MTSVTSQHVENRRLDRTPIQWIEILQERDVVLEIDSRDGRPIYVTYSDGGFYIRTYKSDTRLFSDFAPVEELESVLQGSELTPYDRGELSLFDSINHK
jgi:hypothetical protein